MFKAFYGCDEMIDNYHAVEDAISDLREHWNEVPTGSQVFTILDDNGSTAAVMIRLADPEIAMTVYPDGRTEQHRCHYLTENGRYVGTEVTKIN